MVVTIRFLVIAAAFFACAPAVRAASFDCAKASRPIERAICGDPALSALDEALGKTYQAALARSEGSDAGRLRAEQAAWLQRRAPDGQVLDKASLAALYEERSRELASLPAFPALGDPVEGQIIVLNDVSARYDFTLRMLRPCALDSGESCGAGQLLVRRKGQAELFQRIDLPRVYLWAKDGVPTANMVIGDFDFDGREDFAIQNGNTGSYASPSYDVFLFDAGRQRFAFNEPMTTLVADTMGMFAIDPAAKQLQTDTKGGCCYHETTTYIVERGHPVPVARHSEGLTADGERLEIVDEKRVGGQWQTRKRYEAAKP